MNQQKWDAELYEAKHGFVWQFGRALLERLNPQPGEQILDLGCGTGQLTAELARSGAKVVGLDSSPTMIGQARQNYPGLSFVLGSGTAMSFESEFDAILSNAALHWMLDASAVTKSMSRALRSGGRLVFEMGGHGNLKLIEQAIASTLAAHLGPERVPTPNTFFPTIGQYAALLEAAGFEIRMAELFDRPTSLEGENAMENWIRQFRWFYFEGLAAAERPAVLAEVVEQLRPLLRRDNTWYADYRRLRMIAVKL